MNFIPSDYFTLPGLGAWAVWSKTRYRYCISIDVIKFYNLRKSVECGVMCVGKKRQICGWLYFHLGGRPTPATPSFKKAVTSFSVLCPPPLPRRILCLMYFIQPQPAPNGRVEKPEFFPWPLFRVTTI